METYEQLVRKTHATWIGAVNAGDLLQLLSLMTDDVVFVSPGRPPFGRAEFSTGFLKAHEHSEVRCVSEVEELVISGNVARTRCRDSLSLQPRAGGKTTEFAGYRESVYQRQPDGRWLLAHDAHTLAPVTS
jgi:uncharacterized protein (TIGR02246 family)